MQTGFALPVAGSWATPENILTVARRAEELRYDSLWTFQRLLFPAGSAGERWAEAYRSVLDPLATLGFAAASTSRARLGVAVLNAPFSSPALLAKQLTTLDVLSGGRLDVGLGLGWARQEYAAVGAPYERRGARLDEFVRVLLALWAGGDVDTHGEFYQLPGVRQEPVPVQRPHPPLLLGGGAEPALRRAGRVADGWVSSSGADLTTIGASVDVVRRAAVEAGRDPTTLRFVCRGAVRLRESHAPGDGPLTGPVEMVREALGNLTSQGITEVFVDLNFDPEVGSPDADPAASMDRALQALEAFAPRA